MIKFKDNWVLWQIVFVYGVFILIGQYIVQRPAISNATAVAALIAGAVMAARYSGEAYRILFKEKRGKNGAHYAILGVAEFGYGLVYSGCYRLLWNHMGQPDAWVGTVWSSLGLLMIAKGAFRLAITPDEVTPVHRFPEGFKMVALLAFGLIVGIVIGTNLGMMR